MDENSDRGYDDSEHPVQDEQQPPLDNELESSADRRNVDAAVETGGVPMKHSVEQSHASSSMSSPGQLFVGGLSRGTTEETIANYFGNFGDVVDAVIKKDRMTGISRGFGFVTFADSADADKVLEKEHVIDDRKVDMGRAVHRGDRDTNIEPVPDTRTIFVGGLPPLLREEELKNYFSVYGEIIKHHIIYDHHTGSSKQFGFITFRTKASVDILFSEGKVHELWGKQVNIKRAEPKSRGRDNSFRSYGASGKYDQEDRYGGKLHEDYNMYSGYGGYGGYGGAYAGNAMVNAPGVYGYGGGYGYGYGPYGYGDQIFNLGYGAGGSSNMGGGNGGSAATAYGGGNAHGNSGSSSGSNSGSRPARYHPYQK